MGYRQSDAGEFSDRCDQLPGQYGWAGDWRHSVLGCRAGADSVRKHGLLAGILSKKLKPKAIPALITGGAVSMLLIREDRRPRISSVLCGGCDCDGNWCADTRNFQGSGPENGVGKAAICA